MFLSAWYTSRKALSVLLYTLQIMAIICIATLCDTVGPQDPLYCREKFNHERRLVLNLQALCLEFESASSTLILVCLYQHPD